MEELQVIHSCHPMPSSQKLSASPLMPVMPAGSVAGQATCQVCSQAEAKYRCPGCDIRFCCVLCAKQHKEDPHSGASTTRKICLHRYQACHTQTSLRRVQQLQPPEAWSCRLHWQTKAHWLPAACIL